jgi:hypothetical protein
MHPKYWKFPGAAYRNADNGDGNQNAGGGSLDAFSAASAFESVLDDEPAPAAQPAAAAEAETEDQAAERLAREEAEGNTPADPAAGDAPQSFTIKVDGKDVTLTADEMAEHVKAGMRHQDYTRKTTEVAEQRKAADAEITQARAKRDEYAVKLEQFSGQANYELNALQAQLTDELLQTDPVAYLSTQRIVEKRHAELQQAQRELQQINGQRQTEAAEAQRQNLQQQHEQLVAKLPEWKDPAKAKVEAAKIKDYLATQGYEAGDADFSDHRQIVLANKAMQFDALMERARGAAKKVAAAPPKVERPGNAETAKPGDGRTTAMKNLQKSGSINDAAAAFTAFM